MMRVRSPLAVCLFLLLACNRTGEPHSSGDAQLTPPSTAGAPAPAEKSQANAKPACIIAMAEESPPPAPRALHCPADPDTPSELGRGYVVFSDAPGSPRLNVELARSEAEKERGLMYRTALADAQGMLFSWGGDEQPRTFWMHNTCIPLDMLFITQDGTIAGILEQVPTLNDAPRGVACPAAYVLEVNAGWVRSHGVKSGTMVHFE
jgi:uncharacterized protein